MYDGTSKEDLLSIRLYGMRHTCCALLIFLGASLVPYPIARPI